MADTQDPKTATDALKRQLLVYVPPDIFKRLKIAAAEDGRTVSSIIETLVNNWLDQRAEPNSAADHGSPNR